MELQLLKEQEIQPTTETLESALGESYSVFSELMEILKHPLYGLTAQWKYYRDGKAWLCKVEYRKKTVFWLSVWDSFFRIAFYFTQKNYTGVLNLKISDILKEDFLKGKTDGKFIALIMKVNTIEQMEDILKLVEYKKSLK